MNMNANFGGYNPAQFIHKDDSLSRIGDRFGNMISTMPDTIRKGQQWQDEMNVRNSNEQLKNHTYTQMQKLNDEIVKNHGTPINFRAPTKGETVESYVGDVGNTLQAAISNPDGSINALSAELLQTYASRIGQGDKTQGAYENKITADRFSSVPQQDGFGLSQSQPQNALQMPMVSPDVQQSQQNTLQPPDPMAHISSQAESSGTMVPSVGQPVSYPQAPQNKFRQQIPADLPQVDKEILGGMADALSVSAQRLGRGVTIPEFNKEYSSFLDMRTKLLKSMDETRRADDLAKVKREQEVHDNTVRNLQQLTALGNTVLDKNGNPVTNLNIGEMQNGPEQFGVRPGMTDYQRGQLAVSGNRSSNAKPTEPKSNLAAERAKVADQYSATFANAKDAAGRDELIFAPELATYRVAERIQNRAGGPGKLSDAEAKANAADRLAVLRTLRRLYALELTSDGKKVVASPNITREGETWAMFQHGEDIKSLSPIQQNEVKMLLENSSLSEALRALEGNTGTEPLTMPQLYKNYRNHGVADKIK